MQRGPDTISRLEFFGAIAGLSLGASCSRTPDLSFSSLCQVAGSGRVLVAEHADRVRPAGSIVKLLIAIALIEHYDSVQRLGAKVTLPLDAFVADSQIFGELAPGVRVALQRLLYYMIAASDNFAANVLIVHLGTTAINHVARDLDLQVTRINGLFYDIPPSRAHDAQTTPRDCNKMLDRVVLMSQTQSPKGRTYRQLVEMMLRQTDRRFIPSVLPRRLDIANKTGEISGEINDCAIISPFEAQPVLFSVLTSGDFDARDERHYAQAVAGIRNHIADLYRSVSRFV